MAVRRHPMLIAVSHAGGLGHWPARSSAYLLTPEAGAPALYREVMTSADDVTAVTSELMWRPARGDANRVMRVGTPADLAPAFPTAGAALAPLRRAAEAAGRGAFSPRWAGRAFRFAKPMSAVAPPRGLAGGADHATD